jgi:flagellar protein FliO/FliZ
MATGLSVMDMLRFAGSLLLVFGLLGGLLWGLKRMQSGIRPIGAERQMQVIEAVSVGPRQKIALVRVGGREVLVGVSPTQLTALGSWPAAVVDDSETVDAR